MSDDSTSDPVDYRRVYVPDGLAQPDYSWRERRAELYRIIIGEGTPDLDQNQQQLADRYDVSQGTISKDFKAVRESIGHYMGDGIKQKAHIAFEKAVDDLQEQGRYKEAAELMTEWLDWLGEFGHLDRAPDEHDVSVSGHLSTGEAPDELVAVDLTETDKEHLDNLKRSAEERSASTRIDESGDDLSREDLGVDIDVEDP